MCKVKIIAIFLLMSMFSSFAQKKKFPVAIGAGYEWVNDTERGYQYGQGVTSSYNTKRERLAIDVLYGLSTRLNMKSAIGVSFYNSELTIGRLMQPNYTGINISHPYLFISQTALYDVVQFPGSDFFKIKVSPFISLEYEHRIKKLQNASGFSESELNSSEADEWIARYDIPAIGGKTKSPVGIFSVAGGLSFEAILFKKIGVNYNFGYSYSLFGHSQIDAKYKYKDNEIHTLHFKSKDSGIIQKVGLRYYF